MLKQAAPGLALGLATVAHAATSYPNAENFGRDVDPKTPGFQACLRGHLAAPSDNASHPTRLPASTVEKAAVRIAQRLWVAWVRFAKLRYPALAPETLQAMLTDWRIKQFGRMWSGAR